MKKVFAVVLSAMILFSGCGDPGPKDAPQETSAETEEKEEPVDEQAEEPAAGQTVTEEPAETDEKYVDNAVVNTFISRYNEISESPLEDITNGNIRTKFFAHSYGYYLELLHANDTDDIYVKITETNDTADTGVPGMRDVFHDCVTAIDGSLSDDDIYEFFDSLAGQEYNKEESIGSVSVKYFPDKELSSGHSRGRIEIGAQ